jgi:hypothetical protein
MKVFKMLEISETCMKNIDDCKFNGACVLALGCALLNCTALHCIVCVCGLWVVGACLCAFALRDTAVRLR